MRWLTTLHDYGEAAGLADRMRSCGIALYIQLSGIRRRAAPYLVYVCLERQYDDAVALLANPDYEPRNPVDVDAVLAKTEPGGLRVLVRWTTLLAAASVLVVSVIVWLARSVTL